MALLPRFDPLEIRSPAARWALCVLAVLWAIAGWWIVLQGGLTLSLDKRSLHPVPIDGWMAMFMAAILLALSTVTAAALMQSLRLESRWFALLLFANIGLPLACWFLG